MLQLHSMLMLPTPLCCRFVCTAFHLSISRLLSRCDRVVTKQMNRKNSCVSSHCQQSPPRASVDIRHQPPSFSVMATVSCDFVLRFDLLSLSLSIFVRLFDLSSMIKSADISRQNTTLAHANRALTVEEGLFWLIRPVVRSNSLVC